MKRILIIDDDTALLDVMEASLQYSDYDVKTSLESGGIFELIDEFEPDVVILDYFLNGINGGEICSQIKKNSLTSHLPVIIITAYPRVLESLGAYRSDAVLAKPFNLSDLLLTIDSCIASPQQ
jgi:DNA-binding response OmpR family regulator